MFVCVEHIKALINIDFHDVLFSNQNKIDIFQMYRYITIMKAPASEINVSFKYLLHG